MKKNRFAYRICLPVQHCRTRPPRLVEPPTHMVANTLKPNWAMVIPGARAHRQRPPAHFQQPMQLVTEKGTRNMIPKGTYNLPIPQQTAGQRRQLLGNRRIPTDFLV